MNAEVRKLAKAVAGEFYEFNKRSERFRRAFPTPRHYLLGQQVMPTGQIVIITPGWHHHVDTARKMLAAMLGKPDAAVSPAMKEKIFTALIDDRERQYTRKQNVRPIAQIGLDS